MLHIVLLLVQQRVPSDVAAWRRPGTGALATCCPARGAARATGCSATCRTPFGAACPAAQHDQLYLVVDNLAIHKAKAVARWLAGHPRVELPFRPTCCPAANPIEPVFGDAHDKVARTRCRKRIRDLVADVRRHFARHGPWRSQRGSVDDTPEVAAQYRTLRTATAPAAA